MVGAAQGLTVRDVGVEAEAFALTLDGADAYDASHRCVIQGAGVVDHLHALDLVAEKAVKF